MAKPQKPGEKPKQPGEYLETGPLGGQVQKPMQVTIEPKDSTLPPTQKPGNTWTWIGAPEPDKKK